MKEKLSNNEIVSSERRPVFSKQKAASINQEMDGIEGSHIRLKESGDLFEDSQHVDIDI
jgi:hypothetical protein